MNSCLNILALTKKQTEEVVAMLQNIPSGKGEQLLALLRDRVNPGVDPAAQVKAGFLVGIIKDTFKCELISKEYAIELLGTMIGADEGLHYQLYG